MLKIKCIECNRVLPFRDIDGNKQFNETRVCRSVKVKESAIQSKILEKLKKLGCYTVKVQSASKAGVPDILACYKGKFLCIEVKTPNTKNNTSELQKLNLKQIKSSGGHEAVIWDVEGLEAFLRKIDEAI